MPRNYKHDDSIRQYRVTWRDSHHSHHAYTDTIGSAMALADGLEGNPKLAGAAHDVTVYAWNGLGYVQVRGG